MNQNFISGISPDGVAVDGTSIYWSGFVSGGWAIGRANLDGTGVNQDFIPVPGQLTAVAVDGTHIYWENDFAYTIGRANLDGTGVNQDFISIGSGRGAWGIAVDGTYIYWSNLGSNPIGRANLDGTGVNQTFITTNYGAFGVAVNGTSIYWTRLGDGQVPDSIARANLDGTGVNEDLFSTSFPTGVALDGTYIYYTSNAPEPDTRLLLGAGMIGLAVLRGRSGGKKRWQVREATLIV